MKDAPCPCGSDLPLSGCCGPLLDGRRAASSAEQLMRSRYTAYASGRLDYVRDTWHPSTRPADLAPQTRLRWLGLKVLHSEAGSAGDDIGTVEFVARSKIAGRAQRMHETSRFRFENGRWWYVDGDVGDR